MSLKAYPKINHYDSWVLAAMQVIICHEESIGNSMAA